ncbi:MAG: alternative ribosome rescue aminoacyl-tRNA hydrolase ArfB [Pirellulaceae bacterium]
MLQINSTIAIPDDELQFSFSRSSGPGGQNVNKVSSKATLRWNVRGSSSLPADVRQRFLTTYASKITNDGEILVVSQESRDQPKNIEICRKKLHDMILAVARPPKKRRATKPTKGSKVRRLNDKKSRSQVKANRQVRDE